MSKMEASFTGPKPPVILLLEDDENDVLLFHHAVAQAGYTGAVRAFGDVTEAQSYVETVCVYPDATYFRRPRLIVSDCQLAGHSTSEFIAWMRAQPLFADIPVVMLSGTAKKMEQGWPAQIGVTAFISKTGNIPALASALRPWLP